MVKMQWCCEKISDILNNQGHDFARIKTPYKFRTLAKKYLLPDNKCRLEGNCFHVSLQLALIYPETFYYCEGYGNGTPHAWVALKDHDEDWCLDVTWPFFTLKNGYKQWDKLRYTGVRFEVEDVRQFMLNRLMDKGPNSTSLSMLKYPDEVLSLIK